MARQHRLSAAICAGTLALAAGPAAALAGGAHSSAASVQSGPTQRQIQAAVAKAERSKRLWATVNACAPKGHPHLFGVRGQIPALGFPARLKLVIEVEYWDTTKQQYVPDPDPTATQTILLGSVRFGFQQGGFTWKFHTFHGRLRALVTFKWRRAGKLVGATTRLTTAGHHDADFAQPKGYSAASCRLH